MQGLSALSQKWTLQSKRDRIMLFAVGLLAIAGLMDTYLTNPIRQEIAGYETEMAASRNEIAKAQQALLALKAEESNPQSPIKLQIDSIKQEIMQQQKLISESSGVMVSPTESVAIVKELLLKHKNIHVIAMETLPPESFLQKHALMTNVETPNQVAPQPESQSNVIYQHSIKLQLSGSYHALVQYVADLKRLDKQIAWETAELKAKYPQSELNLVLYTLSTQRIWMGI